MNRLAKGNTFCDFPAPASNTQVALPALTGTAIVDQKFYQHICVNECRNTHHKLVMNSLQHLTCPNAENWQSLFLRNFELYIEGSKAPDTKFKDFRNHVLHVSENFWGGPVKQAEIWYAKTVDDLKAGRWGPAVYSAGVLSHYYMDPLMPLHTGQTEEEGVIHRACEWSVNKSFSDLIDQLESSSGYPRIQPPSGPDWLKVMIHEGAELAHQHYQTFIDHYNLELGKKTPPAGLDDQLREITGQLLGHASVGFARILEKAFAESAAMPATKSTFLWKCFYKLTLPVSWTFKSIRHLADRRRIQKIAAEYKSQGKVIQALPNDEKEVRKLHAHEILKLELSQLDAQSIQPVGTRSTSRDEAPSKKNSVRKPRKRRSDKLVSAESFHLDLDQPLEDAPSIGPKTAKRFQNIGVETVEDFLNTDAEEMAESLANRHINSETIQLWQTQTQLACRIPGIYGHDAQILVACGFDNPEEIAQAEPDIVLSLVNEYAETKESRYIIRGKRPDLDEVTRWIEHSKSSRSLKAA